MPAGATYESEWLAYGTVLRQLADRPDVSPGGVEARPSDGAWPPFPPTYTPCAVPRGHFVDGTGTLHRRGWEPARTIWR